MKASGSTRELQPKLLTVSPAEGIGIGRVAVKCVDMAENTSGEGGFLGWY